MTNADKPATETAAEDDFFIHILEKHDACDHDFGGWREIDEGRGGEQFCSKCGMGAMAHSMRYLP